MSAYHLLCMQYLETQFTEFNQIFLDITFNEVLGDLNSIFKVMSPTLFWTVRRHPFSLKTQLYYKLAPKVIKLAQLN